VRITLLGPQRRAAAARSAVADLVPEGPVAAVNAGWLEREADTRALDDVLGGRLVNLELHRRWLELREADAELETGEQWLAERLAELRTAYRLRLQHSIAAVRALPQRVRDEQVRAEAEEDALAALRALDAWHLARGAEVRAEQAERLRLQEREPVLRHREDVARLFHRCSGLVVTGGHVGVLLHLLSLFGVAGLITEQPAEGAPARPVITWSAGAMALAERVVLFHDHPPYGERPAEVHAAGIGAYAGIVPFPHARRRLRLDDRDHIALLARRLAPSTCLVLTDGSRLDLGDAGTLPPHAARLNTDGSVGSGVEAAAGAGAA